MSCLKIKAKRHAMIKPVCTHAKFEQIFPLSVLIIELKEVRPLRNLRDHLSQ